MSPRIENISGGAIGKAGFKWEVRIVDEGGVPVKPGAVGELCVRGAGVMKRYYNNPQATAEVLKDGWLYTGDMTRTDEDGFIYLVDRKKDVILPGGANICTVQIEDFLRTHTPSRMGRYRPRPSSGRNTRDHRPQNGFSATPDDIVDSAPRYRATSARIKSFSTRCPAIPPGKLKSRNCAKSISARAAWWRWKRKADAPSRLRPEI